MNEALPKPLRGDLTQGPILKTLLVFSVPMLISNVLQTLNGSINAIWVGRLLGESALAATAGANVIMFMVMALAIGFGMATTVRVGQYFGARDLDAMRRFFGTGAGFCFGISVVTGFLGWFWSEDLIHMLSTPKASEVEALDYLRVVFATIPFGMLSMVVSMAMRGAGDSRTPLNAMILTVILDIVFNPLLIRGIGPIPALGIAGSALSTALANMAGLVFQLERIYAKDLPIRLRGRELRYLLPASAELRYVVTKGVPMGASMLILSAAGMVMMGLVNREGLNAAAGYGASMQIWNYLQMPAFAIGSAVSAMVAQSLGAGDHGRVGQVTRVGVITNLTMSTVLAALIVAADRPLLSLFLGWDSPAMPVAERIQLICTFSYVVLGVNMILSSTMRSYGAVIAPLVIMSISMYPVRLGFYYLAYPYIGGDAVWWAFPIGSIVSLVLTWAYYAKGTWRQDML